jgi:hypothetical protein
MREIQFVKILDDAAQDLVDGKRFYDSREAGVGSYFFDCLLTDIESLHLYGGIHRIHFGFYRMLSKRFPFAIYYDVAETTARVAAVLDMRRNPAWIRKELQRRANK